MNDLIVQVSKGYRTVIPAKTFIGNDGENLQTKLIFTFLDEFIDGVGRLEVLIDDEKSYIPLIKENESYYLPIKNVMTKVGNIELQLVITEAENEIGIPLYKSDIFKLYCKDSINAVNEAPEGYDLWIDIANAKIIEIDEKIEEVNQAIIETNNLNITLSKSEGITTITLTKKDGSREIIRVYDGETGNGIESITKTSTSGLVDTYTITYTDGTTTTFEVTNGQDGTDGRGIVSITKTSTLGYVDTYTITYTDGTTTTFEVTNGEVSQAELDETNRKVEQAMMVYNALPKITDTNTELTLDGTANCPMNIELLPSELTQETTPTPDNPQEVQVIKGNNSIKIENKNLLSSNFSDYVLSTGNYGYIKLLNENLILSLSDKDTTVNISGCYLGWTGNGINASEGIKWMIDNGTVSTNSLNNLKTGGGNLGYLSFYPKNEATFNKIFSRYNIMVEKGTTATSYVAHQEQVLPLNLPVENLFDKNNAVLKNGYYKTNNGSEDTNSTVGYTTNYYAVKPNTEYTIQGILETNDGYARIYYYDSSKNWISKTGGLAKGDFPYTFTTPNNCNFIQLQYEVNAIDTNTIQIELGTKANRYTAFGTTPIEYCKIDGYEDEFEHSGDKWYINKSIEKTILNENENWSNPSSLYFQFTHSISNVIAFVDNPSTNGYCNLFIPRTRYFVINNNDGIDLSINITDTYVAIKYNQYNGNLDNFKNWLSSNNVILYYQLSTPTHEEITDSTLISQLNAIEEALSYDEQTNISQTNADLPFRIKASAIRSLVNIFDIINGGA